MTQGKPQVRIKLTPAQQAEVRKATGKSIEALEITVQELEARIAPSTILQKQDGSMG